MQVQALASLLVGVLALVAGCANKSPRSDSGSGSGSASGTASASAPLPTCSDGGDFAGALLTLREVSFCVTAKDKPSCWRLDYPAPQLTPIPALPVATNKLHVSVPAVDPHRAGVVKPPPTPDPSRWTALPNARGDALDVCGPDGCQPFALSPPVNPDDERTGIVASSISDSGRHISVMRGEETVTPMTFELYHRASARKLTTAKASTMCAFAEGFLGEQALFTEWACVNHGGDHFVLAPTGKVTRVEGSYGPNEQNLQVEAYVWAFLSHRQFALYDLSLGKKLAVLPVPDGARVVTVRQKLHVFDPARVELTVYSTDGKSLALARAPTCRYEWEAEQLGELKVGMDPAVAAKLLRETPKSKTKPDAANLYLHTWSFASGVTLHVETSYVDPNTDQPGPMQVVRIELAAPSKLRTRHGIDLGNTRAEVMRLYGDRVVASRSSAERLVLGNDDPQDLGGLVFFFEGDDVAKIHLGRLP